MPTEAEYRTAATNINRYCGVATTIGQSVTDLIANPGFSGGRCEVPVDLSLDAMSADATHLGTTLTNLELELLSRANRCADYTAEIRRWRADLAAWKLDHLEFVRVRAELGSTVEPPGPMPMMPAKPFPEAEAD